MMGGAADGAGLSVVQFFGKVSCLLGNEEMQHLLVLSCSLLPALFCCLGLFLKYGQAISCFIVGNDITLKVFEVLVFLGEGFYTGLDQDFLFSWLLVVDGFQFLFFLCDVCFK